MQITLDRGMRSYELVDPDGNHLGILRFNPSDPGFAGRWQQLAAQGQKLADDPPHDPAGLSQADREMKKLLDGLFAAPVSEVLFGGLSCFALCQDGCFVLEHVIEGVQPVILEALESAGKAAEERIRSRTAKYENSTAGLAPEQAAARSLTQVGGGEALERVSGEGPQQGWGGGAPLSSLERALPAADRSDVPAAP